MRQPSQAEMAPLYATYGLVYHRLPAPITPSSLPPPPTSVPGKSQGHLWPQKFAAGAAPGCEPHDLNPAVKSGCGQGALGIQVLRNK